MSEDAFATAMRLLFQDPNISLPATYVPAAGMLGIELRVVLANGGAQISGLGQLSATTSEPVADILMSDVPDRPGREATLQVAGKTYRLTDVRADPRRIRWRAVLVNV